MPHPPAPLASPEKISPTLRVTHPPLDNFGARFDSSTLGRFMSPDPIYIEEHAPLTSKFTSKERDSESGLDNFGARFDSSTLGRFMTPDPIYMELHRLADPQSLNLYAYVRNNPTTLTDPSGMLIDVDCSKVSSEQCQQTITDLNNRKDAQFQVTRDDKTGQLNVEGKVDTSKLSKSEAELYKAITDTGATGTLQVVKFSASILG